MALVWGAFMKMQSHANQGCGHLKVWLGLEDLLLPWLTHKARKLVLAVGKKSQFFSIWASPKGWLSAFGHVTGFSQNKRSKIGAPVPLILDLDVKDCHFNVFCWSYREALIQCGSKGHNECDPNKLRIVGSHLGEWPPPCLMSKTMSNSRPKLNSWSTSHFLNLLLLHFPHLGFILDFSLCLTPTIILSVKLLDSTFKIHPEFNFLLSLSELVWSKPTYSFLTGFPSFTYVPSSLITMRQP